MAPAGSYEAFLREKVNFSRVFGFDCDLGEISPVLRPHQRLCVQWAVRGGRRALFEAFGLGKSLQQLEILRLVLLKSSGARGLIVCPLGVRQEFCRDATELLGVSVPRFVRASDQVDGAGIYLTNYESVREGKLDPSLFDVVSLDEAGVLRSFGSKTYQAFLTLFEGVPYRFVATATPSPNRYKELLHYAAFLGIMDTGAALTRWFQRDSTKANNLTLYPNKEGEFWVWVSSWSVWLGTPADLGCDDAGYVLPEMLTHYHEVASAPACVMAGRDGQGLLFADAAVGVAEGAREKRETLPGRVEQAIGLVTGYLADDPGDQVIVWVALNAEQEAVERALAAHGITFSSVHGSLSVEECERRLLAWRARATSVLVGKPVMLGQGLNLQQCNKAVFVGVDYRFSDLIQACHRIQRFGQTRTCWVHIVHADSEREVLRVLREKWARHEELTTTMTELIRRHGLSLGAVEGLARTIGVARGEACGEGWVAVRNDCVLETQSMAGHSVDLVVTSIPFSNHYEYTNSYHDFGHTEGNEHFWAQMGYLTPELLRLLRPGRLFCCHVKDRILFGSVTGAGVPTVSPFHAEGIMHGIRHGFDYLGMITVVTDVVRENNQTYRLGWSENSKDSTKMGVGSPEYVLLFRKPQTDRSRAYADLPVTKNKAVYTRARWQTDAHAFWRSSGERSLTPAELAQLPPDQLSAVFTDQSLRAVYDYEAQVATGEILEGRGRLPAAFMALSPGSHHPQVWCDINRMDTLNTDQSRRAQTLHVCPLQRDLVKRLIVRYSNPGELVVDPFAGIMTVPLVAIQNGRRGLGVELNPAYFRDGVAYLRAQERKEAAPTLFDVLTQEGVA